MKDCNELAKRIRDSQLVSIEIDYSINVVSITFSKQSQEISLQLIGVISMEIFDDAINFEYVSHLKCLVDTANKFWLSLDPYDEEVDVIEDKDNYVFCFEDYNIENASKCI